MKIWIRNLTKDRDIELELPIEEEKLEVFLGQDEYIILDSEVLTVEELSSIRELNKFLTECEDNGIDYSILEVLSKVLLYNEVLYAVRNETYVIIDFNSETYGWNCGTGGDFCSDYDKGLCVYESGYYNPFNFEVTEDIHDWIDWESVWVNALTEGWQEVSVGNANYLIHR